MRKGVADWHRRTKSNQSGNTMSLDGGGWNRPLDHFSILIYFVMRLGSGHEKNESPTTSELV